MSGNEAVAKVPTVEEEFAKFQGFSVQDGETVDAKAGAQKDDKVAGEQHAHDDGKAGDGGKDDAGSASKGDERPAAKSTKVELTAEEEETALQDATDKKGAQLSEDEADEVVGKALVDKQRAADKEVRKKDANARIGELTRARRSAERERDAERNKNADLERRLAALERGDKPALTNDTNTATNDTKTGKPDHTDDKKYPYGELDAGYLADLSAWAAREAIKQEREGEKEQKQTQQDAEAKAALKARVDAVVEVGLEEHDDFYEVVMDNMYNKDTNPDGWPCSDMLGELILESDHGAAVAYELASDIKEARRIFQLPPPRQAIWFGQKEAELSAGSAARSDKDQDDGDSQPQAEARAKRQLPQPRNSQARESKAPRPLSKLSGQGGTRVPSEATTDFAVFEAMANGQHK